MKLFTFFYRLVFLWVLTISTAFAGEVKVFSVAELAEKEGIDSIIAAIERQIYQNPEAVKLVEESLKEGDLLVLIEKHFEGPVAHYERRTRTIRIKIGNMTVDDFMENTSIQAAIMQVFLFEVANSVNKALPTIKVGAYETAEAYAEALEVAEHQSGIRLEEVLGTSDRENQAAASSSSSVQTTDAIIATAKLPIRASYPSDIRVLADNLGVLDASSAHKSHFDYYMEDFEKHVGRVAIHLDNTPEALLPLVEIYLSNKAKTTELLLDPNGNQDEKEFQHSLFLQQAYTIANAFIDRYKRLDDMFVERAPVSKKAQDEMREEKLFILAFLKEVESINHV